MYHPAPMQMRAHTEYDLGAQAKIDMFIGDSQVRYARAHWLLRNIRRVIGENTSASHVVSQLLNFLRPTMPDVNIKCNRHGIITEGKVWFSIEIDEVAIALPMPWKPTLDEFMEHYASHGCRIGIELITCPRGIIQQNMHQLTNDHFFLGLAQLATPTDPIF